MAIVDVATNEKLKVQQFQIYYAIELTVCNTQITMHAVQAQSYFLANLYWTQSSQ